MPQGETGMKITIEHLTKQYGDFKAVDDLNLEIQDGELVGLLGPSGCGKSTTLFMLSGLTEPSGGRILFGDNDVTTIPPEDREIGLVFQNYALYPHMTVYDNMAFGLKLRKTPKDEIKRRVEEAAKILDIAHLLNRKPKALSGGQRQRVALGRAIVREPKVFLFDEPLSNLDAKLRVAMRTEITKLHQRLQTTFIYVTHDQTEAMTMASRIVVMKDGFVQQVDTPQNLYDYPANLFVAGFIGSPQMNFFTVKLVKEGNDVAAVFGDNKIIIPPSKLAKFADEDYIGKEVYMGIRPENIHDEDVFIQAAPNAVVDCNVEVTELMGSETYLYLSTSGKEENIIARVNPRTPSRAGQKVQIAFDVNHLHFFDKETETTLLTR